MSQAHRPTSIGTTEREWLDSLPPVRSAGQLRAQMLCHHPERPYPVAQVRGATVIANEHRYSLTSETSDVGATCLACRQQRLLDLAELRRRLGEPHEGVLKLDVDDVGRLV